MLKAEREPANDRPAVVSRSKATLLVIEALQHAGTSRPEPQSRPALKAAPEPRTPPLHQPGL